MARTDALPLSLPPRGLCRVQAAQYVGVSAGTFDSLVISGRMPRPKCVGSRKVWDRAAVDLAFAALPDESEVNPWDEVG
jgi:predicted DNA-binding transcriptional regulator AlpA